MLPILRIIPVGGVLLAIMIVVLALNPPDRSRAGLPMAVLPERGALMALSEHPEWRQFLILAANRRAEELGRLRDLPDTPADNGQTLAGLPLNRSNSDPDDETGSIADMPSATIPIDIGERSSTELPLTQPEEGPPALPTPERTKTPTYSRRTALHHIRRIRAPAKPEPAAALNLFELLFAGLQATPQTSTGAQIAKPATARAEQR
jgi:hypothetical protein